VSTIYLDVFGHAEYVILQEEPGESDAAEIELINRELARVRTDARAGRYDLDDPDDAAEYTRVVDRLQRRRHHLRCLPARAPGWSKTATGRTVLDEWYHRDIIGRREILIAANTRVRVLPARGRHWDPNRVIVSFRDDITAHVQQTSSVYLVRCHSEMWCTASVVGETVAEAPLDKCSLPATREPIRVLMVCGSPARTRGGHSAECTANYTASAARWGRPRAGRS
jgi:hypothetical protein